MQTSVEAGGHPWAPVQAGPITAEQIRGSWSPWTSASLLEGSKNGCRQEFDDNELSCVDTSVPWQELNQCWLPSPFHLDFLHYLKENPAHTNIQFVIAELN